MHKMLYEFQYRYQTIDFLTNQKTTDHQFRSINVNHKKFAPEVQIPIEEVCHLDRRMGLL